MQKRIQASMHTRQSLSDLIEGRLSSPDACADLVKLATRLIVEEALEAESPDALGREYYEHGAKPGQGCRNCHRRGRLKTAEGFIEYAAPQMAGREEGFHSEIREGLKYRAEALEGLAVELLARGLSVRDIEDVFIDESGRLLLSRTAVSELGERFWEYYQEFASKDRGEYEVVYLFIDGIAERIRLERRRERFLTDSEFTRLGEFLNETEARGVRVRCGGHPAPGAYRVQEERGPRAAQGGCGVRCERTQAARFQDGLAGHRAAVAGGRAPRGSPERPRRPLGHTGQEAGDAPCEHRRGLADDKGSRGPRWRAEP